MRAALPLLALLIPACKGEPPAPTMTISASVAPPVSTPQVASAAPAPSAAASAAAPTIYPTEVPIEKLLVEYKDNEVRADGQFKGKLIRTFGTVGQVSKDLTGGIYVTVGTGAQLEHPVVQCMVGESEASAASALSRGGKVTVQGPVGGLMMNVVIRDCVINPMAKLCDRFRVSLGNVKCVANLDTGDKSQVYFDLEPRASGGGILVCPGPVGAISAEDSYTRMQKAMLDAEKGATLLGSPKALCFGAFWKKFDNKPVAFPDDLKLKIQAFFDAL